MFPIQVHNAYILRVLWWKYPWRPQDGNITTQESGILRTCMHLPFLEIHMSFSETRECTVVPLCLHFSPLIYSFFFLPSLHKENKKSTHCADVWTQEESFFFFFSGIIIPFLDSENRRMLFLEGIPKYVFILIASYWCIFSVHSDELHRHFNSSMSCALTIFTLPDVPHPSPRQSHLCRWDLCICLNLGSTNKRNIKMWYLSKSGLFCLIGSSLFLSIFN